ncbi:hypothetical protein E2C01_099345 [Portunus trituberculatus]|uniref:Uncharacterized protein n=1 Tax=Portunus trituberculatus TaxID=210409 RepID=A0A5B7KAR3_PORTR|nr:hypothetical protein [Portunus trituberculatus]
MNTCPPSLGGGAARRRPTFTLWRVNLPLWAPVQDQICIMRKNAGPTRAWSKEVSGSEMYKVPQRAPQPRMTMWIH